MKIINVSPHARSIKQLLERAGTDNIILRAADGREFVLAESVLTSTVRSSWRGTATTACEILETGQAARAETAVDARAMAWHQLTVKVWRGCARTAEVLE